MLFNKNRQWVVALLSGKVLLAEEVLQVPLENILLHGNLIGSR
jgi:hypothetical protein